ncbi:helix-turn-helix domain-containing protein [Cohnella sp. CFH 77786]|uniref:bifunctional transcriptional activator/DNA repair enzyme AdaA n=1 Tax=Cohnella sp. CFH 77786 TaxID=2662265 RepID=UPI001C610A6E|nr:Ada metal-binding domain-containing protein [Cohnella sp. CFH 77786]MBW5449134.1 helix-turn-helix domain-containing protein [Cohnella sp. CFH 77786]
MDDPVFAAVYATMLRRDTAYDGIYYVGIVTTGIFCRPSCRSRLPKPENVRVYRSIEETRRAGFRACKRCKPDTPGRDGPDAELAGRVTDLIRRQYSENLTLGELAARLNVSPYHLQRVYKRTTGSTPAERLLRTRLEAAMDMLVRDDRPVTDISGAVGFRSPSHFSYVFRKAVGCSPIDYRARKRQETSNNLQLEG